MSKLGRPAGKKLTTVKTLAMEPHTAKVLKTSAYYAMMPESMYLRRLILQHAVRCQACDNTACQCEGVPARLLDVPIKIRKVKP